MIFNIELPKKLNKFNYFKKEDEGCTLYSFNGKIGNNYYIIAKYPELEIEKDFMIIDSTLDAIVKLGKNAEVKLNDKSIVAKSEKGKYTGKYVNENFAMPFMNYDSSCGIDLSILVKASMFTSTSDKKPILTGVYVDANNVVMASDSFKIFRYDGKEEKIDGTEGIIIPTSLIKLADGLFDNKLLFISYNKNSFCIKDNSVMLVGNLIDGVFPNVTGLLNKFNQEGIVINKEEILNAIEFTKIAGANQNLKKSTLYAVLKNNMFTGKGDEVFEKEISYSGDEIIFDALFLETVLKNIDSNEVLISSMKQKTGSMSKFYCKENPNEQIVLMGIAKAEE